MARGFVAVAKILGVHGIRGVVRVRCDLVNIDDILNYNLYDYDKESVTLEVIGYGKANSSLVKINNIETRNEAEKLIGKDLFIRREDLPEIEAEDEYYYHDIIGMSVMNKGKVFGYVKDMYNYGAGEILEIMKSDNKLELFSFNNSNFPVIDIKNNTIEINIE